MPSTKPAPEPAQPTITQADIDELNEALGIETERKAETPPTDDDLLDKARQSKNGAKFSRLWNGLAADHGNDASAADLALCNHLAFWWNGDRSAIDRMFRKSGLMRPKWDEKHSSDGKTYGELTIGKALSSFRGGYDQGKAKQQKQHQAKPTSLDDIAATEPAKPVRMYDPFPTDLLPEPLRQFVVEAAESFDCDPGYIAPPLLTAVASAIGNTRRLMLKNGWIEPPIVWSAIIGDSGTVKSPTFEVATKPVWTRMRAILKEHREQVAAWEAEMAGWKATPKKERDPEPPKAPAKCPHPLVSNTTIEAIADRMQSTPRGVLVAVDEFGQWLGSFNAYKKSGNDAAHWLSLFGGRSLKIDRKTGDQTTTYVEHAAACVTGTIQPDIARDLFTDEMFASGMLARILLTYPPTKVKQWTEHEVSAETTKAVDDLFEKLYALRFDDGPDGPEPRLIRLTDDAKERWKRFVNAHNESMDGTTGPVRAALAKLEGYAARFALIFHEVNVAAGISNEGFVNALEIENGIELVGWWRGETERVYQILRESKTQKSTRELLTLLTSISLSGVDITPRELMRRSRLFSTAESWEQALDILSHGGHGRWEYQPIGPKGGAPSKRFILNT